ncbi:MAG: helix-turn-helix domain-containing protein [Phycisphaerales bacterium]
MSFGRAALDPDEIRSFLTDERRSDVAARLLILLEVAESTGSVSEIAGRHGITRQTLHAWIRLFNDSGPDALEDRRGSRSVKIRRSELVVLRRWVDSHPSEQPPSGRDIVRYAERKLGVRFESAAAGTRLIRRIDALKRAESAVADQARGLPGPDRM